MLLYRQQTPGYTREWDESKHPRVPAGSPDGGQFGEGGGGSDDSEGQPEPKPREPEADGTAAGQGSDGAASGPYSRASPSASERSRDVAAVYSLDPAHRAVFEHVGWAAREFHELTKAGAGRFQKAIVAAKEASTFGASVHAYTADEYKGMRLYLTADGKSGFALDGDNIVSVFKHPSSTGTGFANAALMLATQQGGRRLDGFDTVLPALYSDNGFRAVARLPFDDSQAPAGWDKATFATYNGGRPDVVFMVYDPQHPTRYTPGAGPTVASYDAGIAAQTAALKALDTAHEARRPGQAELPAPSPTTVMTQMELWPGLFPAIPAPKKKVELADFAKDKIDLGNFRNDEARASKFLEEWDSAVGIAPAEFKKSFLGGLDGTMNVNFQYSENTHGEPNENRIELQGKLTDAQGRVLGNYTREIDLLDQTAENAYFALQSASQQAKGIGKQMLAGNVATYQNLGINEVKVHADIDVGGYAWAKYGYVPTDRSWSDLQSNLSDKLDELSGSSGYTPESWDEMSSDQQDTVRDAWKDATQDEFLQSEIENWHESGQALDDAKVALASEFKPTATWAGGAVARWRLDKEGGPDAVPDAVSILDSITVDYSGGHEGRADPDISVNLESLTDDQRSEIEHALVSAFNDQAEKDAPMMDPPDHLSESVSEHQDEIWDSMRARDKFSWAFAHDMVKEIEGEGSGTIDYGSAEELRSLIDSDDPKAVWAIADSEHGKDLLLGTDWNGVLDLNDSESMDRFHAYVGK